MPPCSSGHDDTAAMENASSPSSRRNSPLERSKSCGNLVAAHKPKSLKDLLESQQPPQQQEPSQDEMLDILEAASFDLMKSQTMVMTKLSPNFPIALTDTNSQRNMRLLSASVPNLSYEGDDDEGSVAFSEVDFGDAVSTAPTIPASNLSAEEPATPPPAPPTSSSPSSNTTSALRPSKHGPTRKELSQHAQKESLLGFHDSTDTLEEDLVQAAQEMPKQARRKIKLTPSDLGLSKQEFQDPVKLKEAIRKWKKEQSNQEKKEALQESSSSKFHDSAASLSPKEAGRSRLSRELQRTNSQGKLSRNDSSSSSLIRSISGLRSRSRSRARSSEGDESVTPSRIRSTTRRKSMGRDTVPPAPEESPASPSKTMRRRRSMSRGRVKSSDDGGSGSSRSCSRSSVRSRDEEASPRSRRSLVLPKDNEVATKTPRRTSLDYSVQSMVSTQSETTARSEYTMRSEASKLRSLRDSTHTTSSQQSIPTLLGSPNDSERKSRGASRDDETGGRSKSRPPSISNGEDSVRRARSKSRSPAKEEEHPKTRSKSRGRTKEATGSGGDGSGRQSRSRDVRKEGEGPHSSRGRSVGTRRAPSPTKNSPTRDSSEPKVMRKGSTHGNTESAPRPRTSRSKSRPRLHDTLLRAPSLTNMTPLPDSNAVPEPQTPVRTLSNEEIVTPQDSKGGRSKGISSRISALSRAFLGTPTQDRSPKDAEPPSPSDASDSPGRRMHMPAALRLGRSPSRNSPRSSPQRSSSLISLRRHREPEKQSPQRNNSSTAALRSTGNSDDRGLSASLHDFLPAASPDLGVSRYGSNDAKRDQKAGEPSHEVPLTSQRRTMRRRSSQTSTTTVEWNELDITSLSGDQPAGGVIRRRSEEELPFDSPETHRSRGGGNEVLQRLRQTGITSKQIDKLKAAGLKISLE